MVLYTELAILFLCAEWILLGSFFCFLFASAVAVRYKENVEKNAQNSLSSFLVAALLRPETFSLQALYQKHTSPKLLVPLLEKFNRKVADVSWQNIRDTITENYLLPRARKYCNSMFWTKRHLAVRSFALNVQRQDQKSIFSLLQDSVFLIRLEAAFCALALRTKEAVYAVIQRMSKESSFGYLFYKDFFLHSDQRDTLFSMLLQMIPEMTGREKEICLDILATHPQEVMLPLAFQELALGSDTQRLLAVRILAAFYTDESINALMKCLQDTNWKIQEEAAISLGKLKARQSIPLLASLLSSSSWWVRLQAALALKQMGNEGMAILHLQDYDVNPKGYEIAHYVLSLP